MKELNTLVPRFNRAIGLLSKIRHYISKPFLRTLYFSLFNSHLIHACQIWGQKEIFVRKISGLQNKAMRIINFKPFTYPVDELYSSNKILKITDYVKPWNYNTNVLYIIRTYDSSMVKRINCIFIKKVLNEISLEPFHHYFHKQNDNHGHRTRHDLRMPTHPNMDPFQLNTRQLGMRAWNSIPQTYFKNLNLKS